MSYTVPLTLGAKAKEAVELIFACMRRRFTGSVLLEFKDGVPQLGRRSDVVHFGRWDGRDLTAEP